MLCADSVVERRALRESVFPRLREHCRRTLGLDVTVSACHISVIIVCVVNVCLSVCLFGFYLFYHPFCCFSTINKPAVAGCCNSKATLCILLYVALKPSTVMS